MTNVNSSAVNTKRVCFINPNPGFIVDILVPNNLLVLATYLKKNGINVKIIDEIAGDDVLTEVKIFNPDLVCFTAVTYTYPRVVRLLRMIKPMGYKTVIGGSHASTTPEQSLSHGFDMVVVGEGERVLLEIITKGYSKGVFRADSASILKNNELSIPDRSLVNMDFYLKVPKKAMAIRSISSRTASMHTTRGCTHKCIFCYNSWWNIPIRLHSPELMLEEVKELVDKYGVDHIIFTDDDLFIDKDRIIEFCRLIRANNIQITWAAQARADSLNDEVLTAVAGAGCKGIGLGMESGSQKILDVLNKRNKLEKNFAASELCHKHGLFVVGYFMIGNPNENKEDIKLTWKFIRKAKLDFIYPSILTPYPGTELWKWCEREGFVSKDIDFSSYRESRRRIEIPGTFTQAQIRRIRFMLILKIHLLNWRMLKHLLYVFSCRPIHTIKRLLFELNRLPEEAS
ncbi:MAG: radical SAM protein [Candidatus Omnitrophota bacterium]